MRKDIHIPIIAAMGLIFGGIVIFGSNHVHWSVAVIAVIINVVGFVLAVRAEHKRRIG